MTQAPKMVNLNIEETSGVDHPAHLREGWMVVKSSTGEDVQAFLNSLTGTDQTAKAADTTEEGTMPEDQITEPVAPAAEPTAEDFLKAAPEGVQKAFAALQKMAEDSVAKAAAAEESLRKEREERTNAEATEYAKAAFEHLSLDAEKVGPALHALKAINSDLFDALHAALLSAEGQAATAQSDVFVEVGKSTAGAPTGEATAYDRLESMAKAAVEKGEASTFAEAFTAAVSANPDLYTAYINEKKGA